MLWSLALLHPMELAMTAAQHAQQQQWNLTGLGLPFDPGMMAAVDMNGISMGGMTVNMMQEEMQDHVRMQAITATAMPHHQDQAQLQQDNGGAGDTAMQRSPSHISSTPVAANG
ncbi:hypothetical protein FRB95_014081 [Tulasnella sp. JGI-2019a]|nr:hypothetical protein FRB95_014081 [Tulasnella sp. JGI-2019a]